MFSALDKALAERDEAALQQAVFDLGWLRDQHHMIPDEVSFKIIDALLQNGMPTSKLSGHLLNHFEFHAKHISPRAKNRCVGFLQAWGDQFSHVRSQQVVSELRAGNYLK